MEGIEILAVDQIGAGFCFNWLMAIIIGLLIGLMAFALGLACSDNGIIATVMGLFVSILVGVSAGFATKVPTHYVPTYKVTIEDSVNFNEFNEKYEIIEQDGKIYTIKGREDSNAS